MKKIIIVTLFLMGIIFSLGFEVNNTNLHNQDLDIQQVMDERKRLGLKATPKFVNDILSSNKKVKGYGTYLTKEEKSEMQRRIHMQENEVPPLKKYIKGNVSKENYGGIYIDQNQGGVVKVGLKKSTNNLNSKKDAIKNSFSSPDYLRFFMIKNSLNELQKIHEKVWKDKEELQKLDVEVTYVNTDIPSNKVEIGVLEKEPRVINLLNKRYGLENIKIIKEGYPQSTRGTWNGYLEAGLEITKDSATGAVCTSNITVKDGLDEYILTAGHCVDDGDSTWYQGRHEIGNAAAWNSGYADVGSIFLPDNDGTFYLYNTTTKARKFTEYQRASEDSVGDYVCQSSATSDYECGYVESLSYSSSWAGHSYSKQRLATYNAAKGDSGGPVFNSGEIRGIQAAIRTSDNSGDAIYSHIDHALDYIGDPTPLLYQN